MRSRALLRWPRLARPLSAAARLSQAAEGAREMAGKTKPPPACPLHQRARSTTILEPTFGASSSSETSSVKSWDQVPGPKPLPLLGNTWRFIPYIGGYSVRHIDRVCLSLHAQHGACARIAGLLGRPDMLFVFDPAAVEQVFRGEEALPHRPSMPSLNYYKHVLRRDFFHAEENCAGVIAVHGPEWASFRQQVSRAALSVAGAARHTAAVSDVADGFLRRIREIRDENSETPKDFLNEIHKWSLESLGLIALDTRLGCLTEGRHQDLLDAVNTFFLSVGELELRAPWWRLYPTAMYRRYVAALDTICSVTESHVTAAMQSRSGRSLLRQLVEAAGERRAAVAALDMFLVGIDTTSNAMASILYQLSLRPGVQERIHSEISSVLQGRPLEEGDVGKMAYLKACVKEVMRMFPVVIGNGRQLTKDTVICGYNIPKGTQVIFQHYVMGNSEANFPRASEFLPERWLERASQSYGGSSDPQGSDPQRSGGSLCPASSRFASLPFGFGRRMCLGRRFAELEMHVLLCKMVQAFKMEYHHEPLDYHIHPMYTPNGPIRIKLIDR